MDGDKLYVITRKDMPRGYQAVQGMHAALDFAAQHPEVFSDWQQISNYLCFLEAKDKAELYWYASEAHNLGLRYTGFWEPDVGDQLTAIAIEPGERSKELCANLKLALRE